MFKTIKNKYYTYQPGKFLPIYEGALLINKKQFHLYKAKRACATVINYIKTVQYNYRQIQTTSVK